MFRSLVQLILLLGSIALVFGMVIPITPPSDVYIPQQVPRAISEATTTPIASTTRSLAPVATSTSKKVAKKVVNKPQNVPPPETATSSPNEVRRVENPYSSPPLQSSQLDSEARAALVNIYCEAHGSPMNSVSGSGVIIDPRGVVLTNAHVAQYVMLSSVPEIGLSCVARSGSPAEAMWNIRMLYLPAAWVDVHAAEINTQRPKGTGEYDYALLLITSRVHGEKPPAFPFIEPDTREAIGFTSDSVLLAAYPAEFAGTAARSQLYPSTVFTRIGDLLTFTERNVDLISLGAVPVAQSGSSGGAVINLWGKLIGIISTTSAGSTTGDRDLSAVTLSYISRDISRGTNLTLQSYLSGDISRHADEFAQIMPKLLKQITQYLPGE